jgi:hypothetical protein
MNLHHDFARLFRLFIVASFAPLTTMASLRTLGLTGLHGARRPVLCSACVRPPLSSQQRGFAESLSAIVSVPVSALEHLIVTSPVSYGATIVGLTLAVRTSVSLPAMLWTRKRTRKFQETVLPEMKRQNDVIALETFRDVKARGGGPDEYMAELKNKVSTGKSGAEWVRLWDKRPGSRHRRASALAHSTSCSPYPRSAPHSRRCTRNTARTRCSQWRSRS